MIREDLRNIAIIAHVDHGKTTLVDEMLKQGRAFPRKSGCRGPGLGTPTTSNASAGITILAKNTAAHYKASKSTLSIRRPRQIFPAKLSEFKNGRRRRIAR